MKKFTIMKNYRTRHPKEKNYYTFAAIVSGLLWILLIPIIGFGSLFVLMYIIPLVIISWLMSLYFKAVLFGDCVHVNDNQYPEIHDIVVDYAEKLRIPAPTVFVYNSQGMANAAAVRFFRKKYVLLDSGLVDLMLHKDKKDELAMIIGHELAHHAMGHTSFWKHLLLFPSKIVPFLGAAYSRACELTADRVGYNLVGNLDSAQNALVSLASGAATLTDQTNIKAFVQQERQIPDLMGFVHKLYSSHPRMTKRIIEITRFVKVGDPQPELEFSAQPNIVAQPTQQVIKPNPKVEEITDNIFD